MLASSVGWPQSQWASYMCRIHISFRLTLHSSAFVFCFLSPQAASCDVLLLSTLHNCLPLLLLLLLSFHSDSPLMDHWPLGTTLVVPPASHIDRSGSSYLGLCWIIVLLCLTISFCICISVKCNGSSLWYFLFIDNYLVWPAFFQVTMVKRKLCGSGRGHVAWCGSWIHTLCIYNLYQIFC